MKKYFSLIKFREVKVEDAKLLLNWSPTYSFEEGIKRTIYWNKSQTK